MLLFIKTQDGGAIVPFNMTIYIWKNNMTNSIDIEYGDELATDTNITLGSYKTEERAKEILQEILDWYDYTINYTDYIRPCCYYYEMPKE